MSFVFSLCRLRNCRELLEVGTQLAIVDPMASSLEIAAYLGLQPFVGSVVDVMRSPRPLAFWTPTQHRIYQQRQRRGSVYEVWQKGAPTAGGRLEDRGTEEAAWRSAHAL